MSTDRKGQIYQEIWEEGISKAIENQSCSENRTRHSWHNRAFRVEDGSISYCFHCFLERAKLFDRDLKRVNSKYFPKGTWFREINEKNDGN